MINVCDCERGQYTLNQIYVLFVYLFCSIFYVSNIYVCSLYCQWQACTSGIIAYLKYFPALFFYISLLCCISIYFFQFNTTVMYILIIQEMYHLNDINIHMPTKCKSISIIMKRYISTMLIKWWVIITLLCHNNVENYSEATMRLAI